MHQVQENRTPSQNLQVQSRQRQYTKESDKARVATTEKAEEDEDDTAIHEAITLRSDAGTPKLLL